MAKERRTRIQLYFDIISAILKKRWIMKIFLQHVFSSNVILHYDKLTKYLEEMKNKEIIDSDEIKVTEKGKQFHKDYSKINDLIQELSIQN